MGLNSKLIVVERSPETKFGLVIETAKLKQPAKRIKLQPVLASSRPSSLGLSYRGVQYSALND
jgi:hypothetical protein